MIALLTLMGAQFASAGDGLFGTKTSPISSTSSTAGSGMGAVPIAQMFVALLIVLALLKWLMPMLVKKAGTKGVKENGIKIQETASVGPANLYVIEVRGKTFLVGANANTVSCLADLSVDESKLPMTFQEMVDAAPARTSFMDSTVGDALDQLDRLNRFNS